MSVVALVIAPSIAIMAETGLANNSEEVSIEMTVDSKDLASATVNYSTMKDGEKVLETIVFEGTQAEVESDLKAFEASLDKGDIKKVIEKVDIRKE
jgi:K(+)-stimulated pyrophosphate-energized sodium pump